MLTDVKFSAFGPSEDCTRTRENVDALIETINVEARENSDLIDIGRWLARLNRFKNEPWAKVRSWSAIAAAPAQITPPDSANDVPAPGDVTH